MKKKKKKKKNKDPPCLGKDKKWRLCALEMGGKWLQ